MVRRVLVPFVVVALVGVIGCRSTPPESSTAASAGSTGAAPAVSESRGTAVPNAALPAGDATLVGVIAESMDAGGYTYVRLKRSTDEVWVAARQFGATVGEELSVAVAMTMRDFKSPTLDRSFPLLYFASEVAHKGETLTPATTAPAPPKSPVSPMDPMNSHSGEAPAAAPNAPPITRTAPPAGGVSVADVFARRAELSGKPVVVRGTVVKINRGILDRNWLHLQDGSGSADAQNHDLTITTAVRESTVNVGDIVTAKGVLALKRDFGAGYAYDAILEGATLDR